MNKWALHNNLQIKVFFGHENDKNKSRKIKPFQVNNLKLQSFYLAEENKIDGLNFVNLKILDQTEENIDWL